MKLSSGTRARHAVEPGCFIDDGSGRNGMHEQTEERLEQDGPAPTEDDVHHIVILEQAMLKALGPRMGMGGEFEGIPPARPCLPRPGP